MVTKHPRFIRTNSKSVARVKPVWRKARGIDSKQRQKLKSAGAVPKIGFQGPKAIRHLRQDGTKAVLVNNVKELKLLAGMKQSVARIGGTVGGLKRVAIHAEAAKLKIKVLN